MFPNFTVEGTGVSGLIGLVAVLHVFVAHFAVAGGLYLVLTERWGRRAGLPGVLDHARRHSRFFVLVTLVFGALTGVGIWFVIGLGSPDTTFLLIRTFVWGWATEWCFFLIELTAAIVYYKTWDRIDAKTHMAVGWIYAIASIITLLVINGILSFMLTPGDWPRTRDFFDGLLNPSYWSSNVLRIGVAVCVAGCFGLLTAGSGRASGDEATRRMLVARAARWVALGVVIAVPGFFWTKAVLPAAPADLLERSLDAQRGAVPLLGTLWRLGGALFALLMVGMVFVAVAKPPRFPRPVAVLVLLAALVGFGCGEYAREVLRKPWGVYGVMYVNGIRPDEVDDLRAGGYLQTTREGPHLEGAGAAAIGEAMYVRQCSVCHTREGYRGMASLMAGWHRNRVGNLISVMRKLDPGQPTNWAAMPPLVGDEEEISALARWLEQFTQSARAAER